MSIPDAVAHIRSHPEMYLIGGRLDPADFATRLAGDALILGANRTLTVHRNAWWAVAADVDWLAAAPVSPAELFQRIIPFPEAGANSMRSEILVGAYADDVLTWEATQPPATIDPSLPDIAALRQMVSDPLWARVIAFRFEPARKRRNLTEPATAV